MAVLASSSCGVEGVPASGLAPVVVPEQLYDCAAAAAFTVPALKEAARRMRKERRAKEASTCARLAISLQFAQMLPGSINRLANAARKLRSVPRPDTLFTSLEHAGEEEREEEGEEEGGEEGEGKEAGEAAERGAGPHDSEHAAAFKRLKDEHDAALKTAVLAARGSVHTAQSQRLSPSFSVKTPESWPFHKKYADGLLVGAPDGLASSDTEVDGDDKPAADAPTAAALERARNRLDFWPDEEARARSEADYERQLRDSRAAMAAAASRPIGRRW